MGIFQEYSGNLNNDFQVAQGMQNVIKQQQMTHEAMLGAVEKFNTARDEMKQLQAQTGAVLAAHSVDENGKPDDTAPKYVHDLYNAVNKEGGIANMSRSQMISGLKAYETGTSVEANRLQIDAQRIKVDEMKAAIAERNAIREAKRRADEAIKQLGTTKDVTTKEIVSQIVVDGEKVSIPTDKVNPLMERLKKARDTKDTVEENRITDEIEQLIYEHSSRSKPTIEVANKAGQNPNDDSAEDYEGSTTKINKDYKPFVSASSIAKQKEFPVERDPETGEVIKSGPPSPSIDQNVVKAFKESTFGDYTKLQNAKAALEKYNKENLTPEEQQTLDESSIRVAGGSLNQTGKPTTKSQKSINNSLRISKIDDELKFLLSPNYSKWNGNPHGAANQPFEKWGVGEKKSQEQIEKDKNKAKKLLSEKQSLLREQSVVSDLPQGSSLHLIDITKRIDDLRKNGVTSQNPQTRLNSTRELKSLLKEKNKLLGITELSDSEEIARKEAQAKLLTERQSLTENVANAASQMGKPFQIEGNRIENIEGEVTRTVQKSMIEQTQDEYNIVTNHLKQINGYVPENWNLQMYAMSKGIVMPSVTDLGNGHSYVQVGGTGQIVANAVQSTGMSLRDGKLLAEAQRLGQASNMNLSVNGFNFNGSINVNDVDMANKVKDGIFKNTRAISSVNQLLDIAENSSLWDKITPSEVKGIALAIQNQIQAAGRTEIGGSGAWSEQDQARIDKIVQDPTSLFNIVFAKQCIASLKGYRDRITTALNDQGTVYGFKVQSAQNQQQNVQQARVAYWTAKSMGKSDEEALQASRQVLGSNY